MYSGERRLSEVCRTHRHMPAPSPTSPMAPYLLSISATKMRNLMGINESLLLSWPPKVFQGQGEPTHCSSQCSALCQVDRKNACAVTSHCSESNPNSSLWSQSQPLPTPRPPRSSPAGLIASALAVLSAHRRGVHPKSPPRAS